MIRLLISSTILLLLTACGQQQSAVNVPEGTRVAAPSKMAMQGVANDAVMGGAEASLTEISEPQQNADNPEVKKYIALRHHLTLEMPAKAMQANFDAAVRHCERLGCQLLSANYNRETPYSPPSASISLRVPPRNVEIFLSGLAKNSEIMQHGREAEDKTNQVVDADARIKNLTELRDRLRAMLRHQSAQFKDIIEVERELANTQSQLDSIMSMRKVLALETELVRGEYRIYCCARDYRARIFCARCASAKRSRTCDDDEFGFVDYLDCQCDSVVVDRYSIAIFNT